MSNWIKCEERLPDVDECVTVAAFAIPGGGLLVMQAFHLSKGQFIVANGECNIPNVLYWQPLPKAPNED